MWRTSPSDPPAPEASPKPPGHPFVREAGMNRFRFHTLVLAALAIWPAVGSAQHAPVVDQAGSLDQSVSVQQIGTATAVDVAQQAPLARAELGLAGERLAASLRQQGQADAGFVLLMEGSDGLVGAIQSGDAGGSNVASVWQSGAGNSALLDQYASAGMPNHVAQIGRASCRERVCQYV